ncbi:MAG: DUF481 domain-containing protein [Aquificae bacterium]|nr:DUF481 domain-containing protein [Aquificota bacterium]
MKKALFLSLMLTSALMAKENKEKLWDVHIELSFVKTSGNTKTSTFAEKLEVKREGKINRFYLKNSALFASQNGKETANRFDINGRWERLFTERLFGFLAAGFERDKFSGYSYKLSIGPGIGYDVLKTKKHQLKILLSTPYYYNKIENDGIDNYATFKGELYYQWLIRENLKLKEDASYIVDLSDTGKYFINSDTTLAVKINKHLSLGVGYKIAYQSKPPKPGLKKLDTTFSTSLIIDF